MFSQLDSSSLEASVALCSLGLAGTGHLTRFLLRSLALGVSMWLCAKGVYWTVLHTFPTLSQGRVGPLCFVTWTKSGSAGCSGNSMFQGGQLLLQ